MGSIAVQEAPEEEQNTFTGSFGDVSFTGARSEEDQKKVDEARQDMESKEASEELTASDADHSVSSKLAMKTAFYDALPKAKQKEFDDQAPQALDSFIKDQSQITEFGKESVEAVNQVVDQMIMDQKNVRIPSVDDLLEQANRDIDGYVAKYKDDIDDLKKESKLKLWFRNKKRKVDDMAFDRKDLMQRIDTLDKKVIDKREELKKSFYLIRQLLIENKASTNQLVGVLAALEAIHSAAQQRAADIEEQLATLDKNTPAWQEASDKLAEVAEVSNAIEAQHANYMARLAVAWATNSQVRNLLRTQSTVVRNLSMVHIHTIPMMKLSIAQIGQLENVKEGNRIATSVGEANEHALDTWNKLLQEDLPEIERKNQSPILSADSINKLSETVANSNKNIVEAIKQGREARVALENAVMAAGSKIQDADKLRDEELVKVLLNEDAANKKVSDDFAKAASDAYHGVEEDK